MVYSLARCDTSNSRLQDHVKKQGLFIQAIHFLLLTVSCSQSPLRSACRPVSHWADTRDKQLHTHFYPFSTNLGHIHPEKALGVSETVSQSESTCRRHPLQPICIFPEPAIANPTSSGVGIVLVLQKLLNVIQLFICPHKCLLSGSICLQPFSSLFTSHKIYVQVLFL